MVRLTRINHKPIIVNAELIEHLEGTPDTVLTMIGGQKFVVLETTEEVIERVVEYRRLVRSTEPWSVARGMLRNNAKDSKEPDSDGR